MSLWRQITRGWRALTRPDDVDAELDREVGHFFDEAAAAYEASGLSPDEARRAARRELGMPAAVREEVHAHGWETVVRTSFTDARFAARQLRRTPGFTLASILTMALGIGASTAIYSAIRPILLEPLPYPDARRIVSIWDRGQDGRQADITFGTYRELLARCQTCDALAVTRPWQPTLTGQREPQRLEGLLVTADYFRVFGVSPALGRPLPASEDRPGGLPVVVISDRLWRRTFNADAAIVGREMLPLDGTAYSIVGVMPAGFTDVALADVDLWSPLQYDPALPANGREWGHHLRMIGRVAAGIPLDQASRDLDAIARSPLTSFPRPPWASVTNGFLVSGLHDDITRSVRPALFAVIIAVSILLAIACVNATSLLLARAAQRRGELALRAALGAGRRRLVRQLLVESLLLTTLGGALGLLTARMGVRALVSITPSGLPRANAIAVDADVFLFAFAITAFVGVVVGLLPALRASWAALRAGLQLTSRQMTGSHRVVRRALVVAQVALALVLLVGAGLLVRSLQHLFAVPSGFDAANVLVMKVQVASRQSAPTIHQRFAETLAAVRAVPGVSTAALTSHLPLSGETDPNRYGVRLETSIDDPRAQGSDAFRYAVSPGYLESLGIPLRRGRLLDQRDSADAPLSIVISESLARRRFPDRDPIGQRVHVGPVNRPWYTIVGIIGDVKQASLAVTETDAVYVTTSQWHFADNAMWVVVRSEADAGLLASSVREAIWSVDRNQPVVRAARLADLVTVSEAERHFVMVLFQLFGLAALLLAATGAYGVLTEGVTERTREMGVRLALGASQQAIVSLVVREGTWLACFGIALGLGGAMIASRALTTLLFGISRLDAVTYLGVIAVVLAVTLVASAVPAWRAARVDPSLTLRS